MTTVITMTSLARLLQLASPTLPVGAYSYSQGLEAAVEAGVVHDAASAQRWIGDVLELSVGAMEAPLLWKMLNGEDCNELFLASRETAELRAETLQMGFSLRNLLRDLDMPGIAHLDFEELAYPTAFAFAVAAWRIDAREALAACLFAWLENQVLAALKCVPLGQTDGQRVLLRLAARVAPAVERAAKCRDEDLGNLAPGLAMLSSRHETQYTRIFRS